VLRLGGKDKVVAVPFEVVYKKIESWYHLDIWRKRFRDPPLVT